MLHLHPEQDYVLGIARELGYQPRLIHHKRPTVSCAEKLDLLKENPDFSDWTLDRIVKALYFSKNGSPFVGLITPEFKRNVEPKDIFPQHLAISRGKAGRYRIEHDRVPAGMSWGTCTPFPLASSFGTEISDLIFLEYPPIKRKLVDISVGGIDKKDFLTSMHLPYEAIYDILKKQFGERVHLHST